MSIFGDSPDVQKAKEELAKAEAAQAAASGTSEGSAPPDPAAAAAPAGDESPAVAEMRAQLEQQRAEIARLTQEAQAAAETPQGGGDDVKALLNQLVAAQAEYRGEIATLRTELARTRRPIPTSTARVLSAEELSALRMNEVNEHPFYCPGCGRLYDRERECTGKMESPHPAIEVVSTDELKNPPDSSDKAAVQEYQAGHTAMAYSEPAVQEAFLAA